ncbi:GDSL-type esterase/lipase family protein [Allostreptomyces psammosilenae]|uniref:Fibronectin type-III domain-containing protein n=1 Tax=Allostreptomyces psammosilenae TaxID=1892865 RepID=A0A853A096_9ACTN|nr:GDSL-type esterase/lipase family protein [Allostreptomyces psammosilenae]NYI03942.1 hypothetical protein [Allostreptomyces psammosilenae]
MGGTAEPATARRRGPNGFRTAFVGLCAAATTAAGLALPAAATAADAGADAPTVYIASDSTAQTYDSYYAPQTGWGQVIDQFFSDDVTIANHAIGGRSSRSFIEEGRLDAILDEIQPGDYLLVQFGHNDGTVSRPERYTPPEDYKEYLREDYIAGALARGATPVVVTPVSRRTFDVRTESYAPSFPAYEQKAIEVAAEENVPLIDLAASSRAFLDSIGDQEARSVFLHVPPGVYPNRPNGTIDDTHFQEYGATEVARLIAEDIAALDLPLSRYVDLPRTPRKPGRPAAPTAALVSHDGARLTWDAVPGAELYRVQARKKGDESSEFATIASSPIPLADLRGLAESTRYELRVLAVNARGESVPSPKLLVTTREADRRYDFGPAGAPLAEGYAEVTPETVHTPELGYGFTAPAGLTAGDSGPVADALARDYVVFPGGSHEFAVDVPNGTYAVTAYLGDAAATAARTGFILEGGDRGQVIPAHTQVAQHTFPLVQVRDGRLSVVLYGASAHLNGLELSRVGD